MNEERQKLLRAGRLVCQKCGAKGVGYAAHAHAFGWKDYSRASCRYCKNVFKIKQQPAAGVSDAEKR